MVVTGSGEPVCMLCGHGVDSRHEYGRPIVCRACPDQVCQDGLAGQRYRDRLKEHEEQEHGNSGPGGPLTLTPQDRASVEPGCICEYGWWVFLGPPRRRAWARMTTEPDCPVHGGPHGNGRVNREPPSLGNPQV